MHAFTYACIMIAYSIFVYTVYRYVYSYVNLYTVHNLHIICMINLG